MCFQRKSRFFYRVSSTGGNRVKECIDELLRDISVLEVKDEHQLLAEKLNEQYEGDVGIIVSFLLNFMVLEPGEALVLQPNVPHAYLEGEGIE